MSKFGFEDQIPQNKIEDEEVNIEKALNEVRSEAAEADKDTDIETDELFQQMREDAREKHIRQEEAFKKFEAIEAELAEKLGDDFEGLNTEDAERVSRIVSKCDHSQVFVTPLCLKMQNVLEKGEKTE